MVEMYKILPLRPYARTRVRASPYAGLPIRVGYGFWWDTGRPRIPPICKLVGYGRGSNSWNFLESVGYGESKNQKKRCYFAVNTAGENSQTLKNKSPPEKQITSGRPPVKKKLAPDGRTDEKKNEKIKVCLKR